MLYYEEKPEGGGRGEPVGLPALSNSLNTPALTTTRQTPTKTRHLDLDQEHPDLNKQIAQTTRSALGINKEVPSRPERHIRPLNDDTTAMGVVSPSNGHGEQHHLDTDTDKPPPQRGGGLPHTSYPPTAPA
jgi:hypothetical protein